MDDLWEELQIEEMIWEGGPVMDSAGRITDEYVDELLLWWKHHNGYGNGLPNPDERLMRSLESEAGIRESQVTDFRNSIVKVFRPTGSLPHEEKAKLLNYVEEYVAELREYNHDSWFSGVERDIYAKEADMDFDVRMSEAIRNATIHIRSLTNLEHLKLDRNERIGQFITSLRREISTLRYGRTATTGYGLSFSDNLEHNLTKVITDRLCNKLWWYDAGILEPEVVFSRHHFGILDLGKEGTMTRDRLQKWVDYANASSGDDDIAAIGQGLDQLGREMTIFEMHVKKAKEINQEADVVLNNITNILVEAAA